MKSEATHINQKQDLIHIENTELGQQFSKSQPFAKRLQSIIPFVDPDSSRFAEWLWAARLEHGLSTYSEQLSFAENSGYSLDDVYELLKEFYPLNTKSKYAFRAFNETITGIPSDYCVAGETHREIVIIFIGDYDIVKARVAAVQAKFKNPDKVSVEELRGFGQNGPITRNVDIVSNTINEACDEFYPFIEEGVEALIENYYESKSSVLVLIGLPGTGKTTLLRKILTKSKHESIGLANNEQIILDPNFGSWLGDKGNNSLVVVEDADNLILPRSKGNSQMSMLLNHADGVLSGSNKLIISTNLGSTNSIDPALIRPGRTYRIIKFRKLTGVEAMAARAAAGKEYIDLDPASEYTLSEALNFEDYSEMEERLPTAFGFANS